MNMGLKLCATVTCTEIADHSMQVKMFLHFYITTRYFSFLFAYNIT